MRTKEDADDYRYFPEPDLPPLVVPEELIKKARAVLPELPREKTERFIKEYKITRYEAKVLTSTRKLADYFEETAKASQNPEQSSRWIMREVLQHLKQAEVEISEFPVSSRRLAELIRLVEKKEITLRLAKEKVFPEMLRSREKAADIVSEKKLGQISDAGKIRGIILQIVAGNSKPLRQYLEGKTEVLGFFIGQVMKETKGSADPELVDKLLRDILDSHLGGETASHSPFQRSLRSLPPLLGRGMKPRPCDQGGIPPWNPRRSAPRGKPRGKRIDRQKINPSESQD
jgi:aspartyl-tRNA(Asn)/glutamyl-tRNA(Gln) amidotransferase subunit B